ncbi:hypothetical protein FSP39_008545 [Pinctada imbricata]|uniref:Chromo domain-containing protein n=1 Tax=Pinctada imbricata TaxID=66713 RepID=A0AA88YN94_PINIB|nr:hypothetical protein FSP39_008545 [Pinctada imbricata]
MRPLMNKRATTVLDAFKDILKCPRRPKSIRTDKGSEFTNKALQQYFKKEKNKIFYALNETKANYAERYIQTLKKRLYRLFTHFQKYEYKDILQEMVKSINETPNRSINGHTPASITSKNEEEVRLDAYIARRKEDKSKTKLKKPRRIPFRFKIGDQVRITHLKRVFQREYDQTYTEVFIIRDRMRSQEGIPLYKLKDMMDDSIQGSFYASELQKVFKDENTIWRIEKIVKKRKYRGKQEALVRWLGWPSKFDSWVPREDIKDI